MNSTFRQMMEKPAPSYGNIIQQSNEVSQVEDINPGEDGSNPEWFTIYMGELYFSAFVNDLSYDVYSYNPTTNEVTQRTDISGI